MTQPKIEMYTTPVCPYCVRAKALLQQKGLSYQEIDITKEPGLKEAMMQRANGRQTVPQIFINGHHVGGCDDLYAANSSGALEKLLQV